MDELKSKIREIKDWPKKGVSFKDITTLLQDRDSFKKVVDFLAEPFLDKKIDPIEARVTAKTNEGKEYTCVADIFKQIPPLEAKRNKVRAKFLDLCGAKLGTEKAKELSEAILSIEKMGNIRKINFCA